MSAKVSRETGREGDRCERCGEKHEGPAPSPQERPPDGEADPVTHCEFCGAEYPVSDSR